MTAKEMFEFQNNIKNKFIKSITSDTYIERTIKIIKSRIEDECLAPLVVVDVNDLEINNNLSDDQKRLVLRELGTKLKDLGYDVDGAWSGGLKLSITWS